MINFRTLQALLNNAEASSRLKYVGKDFVIQIVLSSNSDSGSININAKYDDHHIMYKMVFEECSFHHDDGERNLLESEIHISHNIYKFDGFIESDLVVWDKMYYPVFDPESVLMAFLLTVI